MCGQPARECAGGAVEGANVGRYGCDVRVRGRRRDRRLGRRVEPLVERRLVPDGPDRDRGTMKFGRRSCKLGQHWRALMARTPVARAALTLWREG